MRFDRRRFTITGAAALALYPAWAGAQPASLFVRRDAYGPQGSAALTAYAAGVAAMKARPASDPTSWTFQANIHGTYDPRSGQASDIWNSCQHGSWHFLSWHRIYLFYFERIVRAASSRADFALPYWNYAPATRRAIPRAFRTPASASNPLYVARRNDGSDPDPRTRMNVNRGDPLPPTVVGHASAMAQPRFSGASGAPPGFGAALETQPHNIIHVALGGAGLMSDPNTAAQDPIFWLHHCNIDRLWSQWSRQPGRSAPSSLDWRNRRWTFFDETGQRVEMSGQQVLETASQLNYRYDDDPVGPAPPAAPPTEAVQADPVPVATAAPVTLNRTAEAATVLRPPATESARRFDPTSARPTYLVLEGFEYRGPQATWYEVYVNAPAGKALRADGPYFAGNLALFGLSREGGHHDAHAPAQVVLEVGEVLANQRRRGLWSGGEVRVSFVPRGPKPATEAATPPPRIDSIRLAQ